MKEVFAYLYMSEQRLVPPTREVDTFQRLICFPSATLHLTLGQDILKEVDCETSICRIRSWTARWLVA